MYHVTTRTVIYKAPPEILVGMGENRVEKIIEGLYCQGLLRPGGTEISAEYYKPLETYLLNDKGFKILDQIRSSEGKKSIAVETF